MDWIALGLLLIVLGMLFIAIGVLALPTSDVRVEGAAVVFIGPIPLVIGSSRRAVLTALVLAVLVMAVMILWSRR